MPTSQNESAEEWGTRQAESAPPCSEAKWRCRCLRLGLDPGPTPEEASVARENQPADEFQDHTEDIP